MSYQILIVDDDDDFREELSAYLHQYQTLEASNGEEALRLIKKPNSIDLVILDIVMSGVDGIEALKEIKKIAPNIGIIILTGRSSKEIIIEALRGNADDYIEKPVDINRLDGTIRRILKGKEEKFLVNTFGINRKIEQAKRFIERNYDKMVNLKDVAAEVCLSPKYLSRIFKKRTGLGFNDYKLELRTKKAREFLKKTEYTINQISEKFGYKNLESFIRIFKKKTGIVPTAYRKEQIKKLKKLDKKK